MKFYIDAQSLPRYQMLGMLSISLLLTLAIFSYFLIKHSTDSERRLAELKVSIIQQQKAQLRSEMSALLDSIQLLNANAEQLLKAEAKQQVNQAYAIAEAIYTQEQDNRSEAELKALIREALRKIRFFNGRGYIFIHDMQGRNILLPSAPQREGDDHYDLQDDTGAYITRGLIEAVSNPQGAGFSQYRWYRPGDYSRMADKISYVRHFEPFDWIIGGGDYLYRIEHDLKQQVLQRLTSIRFGDHGYIAMLNTNGKLLSATRLEWGAGQLWPTLNDAEHPETVQRILHLADQGGGFIEYDWLAPDRPDHTPALALVERVPGWDWILVANLYPNTVKALLTTQRQKLLLALDKDKQALFWLLLIVALVTSALALVFGHWMRRLFNRYQADIDRKQAALQESTQQLKVAARVFECASEAILITDSDNRIQAVNRAFTQITGYGAEEVQGKNPNLLSSGRQDETFYRELWQSLKSSGTWQGEIWNRRHNGEVYPEWLSISTFYGPDGRALNYIATFTDITERKQTEEQLHYLAHYDPLTGLANRRLLGERVLEAINRVKRHPEEYLALMFIDLDHFKHINDSLGHACGDELLKAVAQRLNGLVRETDTISRLGGDEFVVLITGYTWRYAVVSLVERIQTAVSQPLQLSDQEVVVTPSIGIAIHPEDGKDFNSLLKNADTALYKAKAQNRNNYQFFTPEMNRQAFDRLQRENALRQALDNEEFELHYQPQYSLHDDALLVGAEALVRWRQADGNLVPPGQFIPLAEESGLILPLGKWVLEEACRQGATWLAQGLPQYSIAVNVSAHQFRESLVTLVRRILANSGFPARLLVLEVTESMVMKDVEQSAAILRQLKALGVSIALDDFGTGYSSLAYLKRFPLDKLKIDRAFVEGLPDDKDDRAITSSIIDIARNLDLCTVAEGIETPAQHDFLMSVCCDEAQGYLYARPLLAAEFERLQQQSQTSGQNIICQFRQSN